MDKPDPNNRIIQFFHQWPTEAQPTPQEPTMEKSGTTVPPDGIDAATPIAMEIGAVVLANVLEDNITAMEGYLQTTTIPPETRRVLEFELHRRKVALDWCRQYPSHNIYSCWYPADADKDEPQTSFTDALLN